MIGKYMGKSVAAATLASMLGCASPELQVNCPEPKQIRNYTKRASAQKYKTERFKNSIIQSILYMAYVGGSVRSLETVKGEDLLRVCPDCGNKDIEYANEEFYCSKCGLVLD